MPPLTELPISLVAHTVFCERRAWIEAVGERVDSAQIESGLTAHSRVDRPEGTRSVDVSHPELGLVGRCDIVTAADEGRGVDVVEYKATPVRQVPQVTDSNIVQLTLQRLCL